MCWPVVAARLLLREPLDAGSVWPSRPAPLHNANFVIERCRTTVAGFHRRGRKVWRSEQLLLSDIEFEWIRQFYVQGLGHKKILWQVSRDTDQILCGECFLT